jgi:hypothetical protein
MSVYSIENASTSRRVKFVEMAPLVTAMVFLAAVALKVQYLRAHPIIDEGLLHSRMFSTVLLQVELLMAGLLLNRSTRRGGVVASILLLIGFTLYNLSLSARGATACGCLGALSARPQVMAVIDFSLVVWLISWSFLQTARLSADRRAPRHTAALLVLMPVCMATTLVVSRADAVPAALVEGLEVAPQEVNLGEVDRFASASGTFTITNHRTSAVTITSISRPAAARQPRPARMN